MMTYEPKDGLIFACRLADGAPLKDWDAVAAHSDEEGPIWVHLEHHHPRTQEWIRSRSEMEEAARQALTARETRPRFVRFDFGVLINLRGINLNEGDDPEDMIALRIWIDDHKVITLRRRRLRTVQEIRPLCGTAQGPKTPGMLVGALAAGLTAKIEEPLDDLDDALLDIEELVSKTAGQGAHTELAALRRRVVTFRRHIAPQRETLVHVLQFPLPWLTEGLKDSLHETIDSLTRHVETLEELRDRATITREELTQRFSEDLNRRMLVLSLITAVFLPLGLVTGLLGINVGGVPGSEHPWGFAVVCGILLTLTGLELLALRWLRWL